MLAHAFESPEKRARIAVGFLVAIALLDVVNAASSYLQLDLLERVASGIALEPGEAESNDTRESILGGLYGVVFFGSGVAFLTWFHRLYRNVEALRRLTPRWTASSAVWAFFIPFVNLVRPYNIMSEVWVHVRPSDDSVARPPLGLWWAAWIATNVLGQVSFRGSMMDPTPTVASLVTSTQVQLLDSVLSLPAAVLAALVVQRMTTAQVASAHESRVDRVFG